MSSTLLAGTPEEKSKTNDEAPIYQCPTFPMLAQGSAGALAAPICNSSTDTLSGLRIQTSF